MNALLRLLKDESGATAIEYGLIVSITVVGLIAAIQTVGKSISSDFSTVSSSFGTR